MEPRIRPGDRVATADLGEGVVVEVLGDRANVTLEDVNNLVIGYSLSDLRRLQPSVPDITVEDIQPSLRCGAGDSFAAGTAVALRVTRDAAAAARFGNRVAGITIMKKGTGTASPAEIQAAGGFV